MILHTKYQGSWTCGDIRTFNVFLTCNRLETFEHLFKFGQNPDSSLGGVLLRLTVEDNYPTIARTHPAPIYMAQEC